VLFKYLQPRRRKLLPLFIFVADPPFPSPVTLLFIFLLSARFLVLLDWHLPKLLLAGFGRGPITPPPGIPFRLCYGYPGDFMMPALCAPQCSDCLHCSKFYLGGADRALRRNENFLGLFLRKALSGSDILVRQFKAVIDKARTLSSFLVFTIPFSVSIFVASICGPISFDGLRPGTKDEPTWVSCLYAQLTSWMVGVASPLYQGFSPPSGGRRFSPYLPMLSNRRCISFLLAHPRYLFCWIF